MHAGSGRRGCAGSGGGVRRPDAGGTGGVGGNDDGGGREVGFAGRGRAGHEGRGAPPGSCGAVWRGGLCAK